MYVSDHWVLFQQFQLPNLLITILYIFILFFFFSISGIRKGWCFNCEFESLILKVKEGRSPLSPVGIISQLPNIGRQLGNGKEEDAHEFLRCVTKIVLGHSCRNYNGLTSK